MRRQKEEQEGMKKGQFQKRTASAAYRFFRHDSARKLFHGPGTGDNADFQPHKNNGL